MLHIEKTSNIFKNYKNQLIIKKTKPKNYTSSNKIWLNNKHIKTKYD